MTTPLLSICIPTYNRYKFLEECLDSISTQSIHNIEIVISDNASDDNTPVLVAKYAETLPIKFHRFESNRGFDENCAKVIELASGTYCMLLGSDDILLPRAVESIVRTLKKSNPDILHAGYRQCEFDIKKTREDITLNEMPEKAISTASASDYFSQLPNLSTLLAFISSFIFRREKWPDKDTYQKWIGTHYIHLFCMHHLISTGCKIKSTCDLYISARGDNINEWSSAPGKHLALDAKTFTKIVSDIYDNNIEINNSIFRIFKKSYPYMAILNIFANGGIYYIKESFPHLIKLGYSRKFIAAIRIMHLMHLRMPISVAIKFRRHLKARC